MAKKSGYDLSRHWFNFSFEKEEAKVIHTAIYMWILELSNRLGWKEEFGLPTQDTMEGLSIGNKTTYLSAIKDLVEWKFIEIVKESKNQYQSMIIKLCYSNNDTARGTALDMALQQHRVQHCNGIESGTGVSIATIDKPETIKPLNQKPETIPTEVGHEYHSPKITEDEEKKKVAEKKKSADEMYPAFLALVNKYTGRKFRESDKSRSNFRARVLSGFTLHDFETALKNVITIEYHQSNGFRYITPEFITREEKLQMYSVPTNQKSQVSDNSSVAHLKVYV